MRRTDLTWRLGTIGFGYAEWKGVFFPPHAKAGENLSWYASHFDTVELDTTFHAIPPPERVRGWASKVDAGFRFAVKVPKMITHEDGIDQKGPLFRVFIDTMAELEDKLGVYLMQFQSTFDVSRLGALLKLLDAVRTPVPLAIEFRHRAWFDPAIFGQITQRGATIVANEYLDKAQPIVGTAPIYVRLLGEHDRFPAKNHEAIDIEDRLAWWVARIEERAPANATVWVFANNDYAGYSIATIGRLRRLIGLSEGPRIEHPKRSLFD